MLCNAPDKANFWHIQNSVYSSIFWHIQAYSALLRHANTRCGINGGYSGLFRHILPSHIHNLARSERWHI